MKDTYMKKSTIILAAMTYVLSLQAQKQQKVEPFGPVPTENQLRWQDLEMYAFIHYSLNTYTDQE